MQQTGLFFKIIVTFPATFVLLHTPLEFENIVKYMLFCFNKETSKTWSVKRLITWLAHQNFRISAMWTQTV